MIWMGQEGLVKNPQVSVALWKLSANQGKHTIQSYELLLLCFVADGAAFISFFSFSL